jgi:hypothetical protein
MTKCTPPTAISIAKIKYSTSLASGLALVVISRPFLAGSRRVTYYFDATARNFLFVPASFSPFPSPWTLLVLISSGGQFLGEQFLPPLDFHPTPPPPLVVAWVWFVMGFAILCATPRSPRTDPVQPLKEEPFYDMSYSLVIPTKIPICPRNIHVTNLKSGST